MGDDEFRKMLFSSRGEFCGRFLLLMDPTRGFITFNSLRRKVSVLELDGMVENELRGMLREGDLDGDVVLNQMDFRVLIVLLSLELMKGSWRLVEEAFL